jgi:nitroreductase
MPAPSTMTVREAAEFRRSVHTFVGQEAPEGDLREILRLTRLAPSPDNCQPWRFVVIRDPDLRARILPAALNQRQVASAPALIVLYTDMEDVLANVDELIHPGLDEAGRASVRTDFTRRFGAQSKKARGNYAHGLAYIALGYLLLAAESMGYQTSPMLDFKPDEMKKVLGLPAHVTIPALVGIGKGAEPGVPHHRHSVERIARFV